MLDRPSVLVQPNWRWPGADRVNWSSGPVWPRKRLPISDMPRPPRTKKAWWKFWA